MTPQEIRVLRDQLELTQEMFARILGVSFATVNRWENGKSEPSGDYARVLQTLRKVTVSDSVRVPIDWKRVGALSAMAAVAGFSPLLTLGAALAPVLIAQLPSWADVPVGSTAAAGAFSTGPPTALADPAARKSTRSAARSVARRGRGRTPLRARSSRPRSPTRTDKDK